MTTLITVAKETSVKLSVGDTLLRYYGYLICQDKSHKLESNKKRVDNLVSSFQDFSLRYREKPWERDCRMDYSVLLLHHDLSDLELIHLKKGKSVFGLKNLILDFPRKSTLNDWIPKHGHDVNKDMP